jgi:phosphoribosylformimino-5-aminoimidazole carboxamide ribotide isomerase
VGSNFEVIPAIDVSEGKLCRLAMGGPAAVEEFGGDPLSAARSFVEAGAGRLHVVDVDLAFTGRPRNADVLAAIRARFPRVPIQASGGISMRGDVQLYLDAGAHRVVLGSGALADRADAERLISRYGERLVVGVETEAGRIRPRGAPRGLELDLEATLAWLRTTEATRFLHTNVRRVGELSGPDLRGLATVLGAGRPALVAGGISSIEDLLAARAAGAEGAVVGRAALTGVVDLAAAISELGRGH